MAESFLHQVAQDVLQRLNGRLENCAVIFPNKRPTGYFIRELQKSGYALPHPAYYSVEEFIDKYATASVAEPVSLLFTLYKIYLRFYPETDFDEFYGWGNLMLSDFDDIDRYMTDAASLFKSLSAVKDLEKYFLQEEILPTEALPELREEDREYLVKKFLEIWQVYEKSYFALKQELKKQRTAYPGLNYREVAEKFSTGNWQPDADMFVFIGFNALSKSEETIIQSLIDRGNGLIYWDADTYYTNNGHEESGYFIRKSMRQLRGYNPQFFSNGLSEGIKDIHIIGAPLLAGQAKTLGVELKKHVDGLGSAGLAIVLPDENMLSPVRHVLPELQDEVNFTSGKPLKYSLLFSLFHQLFALNESYRPDRNAYYHKDLTALLSNPLVRENNPEKIDALLAQMQDRQTIYVPKKAILNEIGQEMDRYFRPVHTAVELGTYFKDILQAIRIRPTSDMIEKEIAVFEQIFTFLDGLTGDGDPEISRKAYFRILKEKVNQAAIPFGVDAIDGLQVMGILETRCLDFETVFILSANEGILPGSSKNRSYIPFDLRKNFGLPTWDEQDKLYAYNFYRLLQRAAHVYIFYNAEAGSGGDEKSRYLRQLEYSLPRHNPGIGISKRFYSLPLKNTQPKDIVIPKDDAFYKALAAKNESGLAPTFISAYFICSLQFYFRHILNIPEREEIVEDLEARHFGTLFHKLMEYVYEDLKDKKVDAETLTLRKSLLSGYMAQALAHEHKGEAESILQKNYLLVETVKILAEKALEADIAHAPFTILDTEVKVNHSIQFPGNRMEKINFKGIIDRIDEKDGIFRIVDYKTGKVKNDSFRFADPEELLHKDNKEAFQTVFYSYLYAKNNPGSSLSPHILPLKEVVKGYLQVNPEDEKLDSQAFAAFEEKLKSIILAILDPENKIVQTEDRHICAMCSYKNMCMR